jgi:hypothetical protein
MASCGGAKARRRRSTSQDVRFTLDGFHALLAPQTRCFSAFPYGTCLLSVTALSYLALDGQHHPYSASTFKLTYSRASPLPAKPTRSRVTPCASRCHPVAVSLAVAGLALRLQVPKSARVKGIRSRAVPFSLAATTGISIDFFSSADLYA